VCKELVYVLEGFGTLNTKNEVINFEKGDVLLINKGDMYFWDGNCKLILVCTPPWYKEQYKLCEE
jgi:quercetin dioxygenase-like cupin family protein